MDLELVRGEFVVPALVVGEDEFASGRHSGVQQRGDQAMLDLVAGPPWIVEGIANEAGHHVVAAPAAAYPPWPQGHQRGAVTEIPQRNRSHWRREPREE